MAVDANRATWAIYQAAWEDVSAAERLELLHKSVADDVVYLDPQSECKGFDALLVKIQQTRVAMPKYTFRNHMFLMHHAQSVAAWDLVRWRRRRGGARMELGRVRGGRTHSQGFGVLQAIARKTPADAVRQVVAIRPSSASISCSLWRVEPVMGTMGRRRCSACPVSSACTALTGAGLGSQKWACISP